MKKLLALMLALMMVLAGLTAAGAEAPAASEAPSGGTITIKATLNSDVLALMMGAGNESAAQMAETIAGLVNGLSIVAASDGVDAEMSINLNDQSVLGVGVINGENERLILSDLFPNSILKIDQETLGAAQSTLPSIPVNPEQMAQLAVPFTTLVSELMTKIGEPEVVEMSLFDTSFVLKQPVNLTTKEALTMLLTAIKGIVNQEGFASLLEQAKMQGLPLNFSMEDIDKKIEELANTKEEDLPVMDASVYSNESGDAMFVIGLTKNDETITVSSGTISGVSVTEVDVPEKAYVFATNATEAGQFDLTIQIAQPNGSVLGVTANFISGDNKFAGAIKASISDVELLSLAVSGVGGTGLSGSFTTEGKTEVSVQALSDQSSEATKAFMTDFQTGVMLVMGKIINAYPAFAVLMQGMMPQTAAPAQK